MSNDAFIAALGNLTKVVEQAPPDNRKISTYPMRTGVETHDDGEFQSRYGRGMVLEASIEAGKTVKS